MISLSLHSSSTYIGFFLSDGPENVIKSFAAAFATEATVLAGNNNPEVMMSTGTRGGAVLYILLLYNSPFCVALGALEYILILACMYLTSKNTGIYVYH